MSSALAIIHWLPRRVCLHVVGLGANGTTSAWLEHKLRQIPVATCAIDTRIDMCAGMCTGMCTGMCMDMCMRRCAEYCGVVPGIPCQRIILGYSDGPSLQCLFHNAVLMSVVQRLFFEKSCALVMVQMLFSSINKHSPAMCFFGSKCDGSCDAVLGHRIQCRGAVVLALSASTYQVVLTLGPNKKKGVAN